MEIRQAKHGDQLWDMLLEADPDYHKVAGYLYTGQVYVADVMHQSVGVIVVQQNEDRSFEIKNLIVKKEFRRKGIASQLLSFVTDRLKENVPNCHIYVKTANTSYPALALYTNQGFVVIEIIEKYFTTHYKQPIFENGQQAVDQYILKFQN